MENQRKLSVDHINDVGGKKEATSVRDYEVNPAAAALAAATNNQKPPLFSKGMIRLWVIVSP